MALIAHGVIAAAANQSVVTQTAVDDVVLLVPGDRLVVARPDDIRNSTQGVRFKHVELDASPGCRRGNSSRQRR